MQAAIITMAGISSRFNLGIPEPEQRLKAIYYERDPKETLLLHMLKKCSFADEIVVVGGYKYEDLLGYIQEHVPEEIKAKVITVYNEHYYDLPTGYSLYCGLKEVFDRNSAAESIVFAEGDLDVDDAAFNAIIRSAKSVLTYNHEIIKSDKAVVLYKNEKGEYKYAFNSSHGMLRITEAFESIYNSGQVWKFSDIEKLKEATGRYYSNDIQNGTNLKIIEYYVDRMNEEDVELVGFDEWTNCNTRDDYRRILKGWEC